jgi:hypothetical protein
MVLFLILDVSGDVKEVEKNINPSFKLEQYLPLTSIKGVIQHKGKSKLERLVIWHENDTDIHVYGYKSGTSDNINRHCPPKPLDKIELYGDILMIASIDDKIVDMNEIMYIEMFNEIMEDCDNQSQKSCDMYDDNLLPEDAELINEEINYDNNSQASNDYAIDIIEDNDNDDISCDIEVRYDVELEIEPEYIP